MAAPAPAPVAPFVTLNNPAPGVNPMAGVGARPWATPGATDPATIAATGDYRRLRNTLTANPNAPSDLSTIIVWTWTGPAANADERYRYWCHGHSLQTRDAATGLRYSISSTFMHLVLLDPNLFDTVQEPEQGMVRAVNQNVQADDIIAWFEVLSTRLPTDPPGTPQLKRIYCTHSARVVQPAFTTKQLDYVVPGTTSKTLSILDVSNTRVTTKNGSSPVVPSVSLKTVQATYATATTFGVYRRRAAGAAVDPYPERKLTNAAAQLKLVVDRAIPRTG